MNTARIRIVDAAVELIALRGYAATTTKAIAELAGVNEVTLFRHFGSKRGVLDAIGERLAEAPRSEQISPDVPSIRDSLKQVAKHEIRNVSSFGACAIRLGFDARDNSDVAEALSSEFGPAANVERLAGLFGQWQGQGRMRSDLPASVLAEAFSALTSSFLLSRVMMGGRLGDSAEDEVAAMVELFCDGVLMGERS